MIKACIFPKSPKRQGQILKVWPVPKFYVYDQILDM